MKEHIREHFIKERGTLLRYWVIFSFPYRFLSLSFLFLRLLPLFDTNLLHLINFIRH